jgi:hypothetical protein
MPTVASRRPREERLDPRPFGGERLVPVLLEHRREPVGELDGVVEEEGGRVGSSCQHGRADAGVAKDAGSLAPVVVERPAERGQQELGRTCPKPRQLLLEALRRVVRARDEEIGDLLPVGEPERVDLAPQGRIERAHAANPVVVQRVMLGPEQDVEAEHALVQG